MRTFFASFSPSCAVLSGLSAWALLVTLPRARARGTCFRSWSESAFGSRYDFGMTLFYSTPLVFTGLSVAMAFHAGLFNIGAEGQLTLGALAAAVIGIRPSEAALAARAARRDRWRAFAAGALWGAIPGWLRARRGSHEVINTIMLNFIAAGLASYVTLYLFRGTESQNPETAPDRRGLHDLAHLTGSATRRSARRRFSRLLAALVVWVFLWKTPSRVSSSAPSARARSARAHGGHRRRPGADPRDGAGGRAGRARGRGRSLGNAGQFKLDFRRITASSGSRSRCSGAAIRSGSSPRHFFSARFKGTADLDIETENVTRDLSLILQALVILCVSADGLWTWIEEGGRRASERVALASIAESTCGSRRRCFSPRWAVC